MSEEEEKQQPLSFLELSRQDDSAPRPLHLSLNVPADARSKPRTSSNESVSSIPSLTLPTRWEFLKPKLEQKNASIKTIIRPVPDATEVVEDIIEYLNTTGGCQLLVIRGDTGSGKTTFINTLAHYV